MALFEIPSETIAELAFSSVVFPLPLSEDYDECLNETHGCDTNATCANTLGSYLCECEEGFRTNSLACEGES